MICTILLHTYYNAKNRRMSYLYSKCMIYFMEFKIWAERQLENKSKPSRGINDSLF